MFAKFPHKYKTALKWQDGSLATVDCNQNTTLQVGPPPQFDGSDDKWSPEDLLLASIQSCLMTTFINLAGKKELKVIGLEIETEGTLEKTKEGLLFTSYELKANLRSDNPELGTKLLGLAENFCIISNALKVAPTLTITST